MTRLRTHETPLTTAVRRGMWALTSLAVPGWALAAPQGGLVVAGSASIAQQGTKTTITQSTAKGAINWQSFSIGTSEYVQFIQPGTTSVTLNRVVGNDPSQLLGQMSANGQIFLVNPNGVYFGPNAVIDVAGLLATTFDISNDDFMAGRYTFARVDGRDPASVINDGTINADGGYVILAGDGVANHGLIEAYLGDIVMASGQQVTLDLGGDGLISFAIDGEALTEIAGVENTGALYADGGRIFLTAKVQGDLLPTAVNHEGLIQARTVDERDGIVYLGGSGGDVMIAGDIDADAGTADADGGGIFVLSDIDVTVSEEAGLTARGSGSGDGGVIRLIAEEILDVEANTTVTTEGGSTGQGGFVEVSGHGGLNVAGEVTPGAGGQLVVDPGELFIAPGGFSTTGSAEWPTIITGSDASGSFSYTQVREGFIEEQLNNNIDLTLVATDLIGVTSAAAFTGGIEASGSGDLTLAIGLLDTATGGSLGNLNPDLPCNSLNVCGLGSSFVLRTSGSGYNVNGVINLKDASGDYVDIDIAGGVSLTPGTGVNGYIDLRSVTGASVDINGEISVIGTDSLNPVQVTLKATAGDVNFMASDSVVVRNNSLGGARLEVTGNTINVPAGANITVYTPSATSGAGAQIIFNAVQQGTSAPAITVANGANIVASAPGLRSDATILLKAIETSTGSVVAGGLGPVSISGQLRTVGKVSEINVQGNGISVNFGADLVAQALGTGSGITGAFINLNAGDGQFFWGGGNILAADHRQILNCGKGGATCFGNGFGATDSGSFVSGLVIPNYPLTEGSAQIDIFGASVDLSVPFGSSLSGVNNVRGLLAATAANGAEINVRAFTGDILLGSSDGGGPLLLARSGISGSAPINATVTLNAAGLVDIHRPGTPIIEGGLARYYSILSDVIGRDALIDIDGGTVGVHVNQGAVIHARASDSGASIADASIDVDVNRFIGGTVTIDGELSVYGTRVPKVQVRAPTTLVSSTAKLEATGTQQAEVGVDGYTSMQLDGDLIAIASSGQANVYISGSSGLNIGASGSMLASGQGSLGGALAWAWGGGDVVIDGQLRAVAGSGTNGTASVGVSASGSAGILIGSSALLEASGLQANVSLETSNSTGAAGLVAIDGDINAIATAGASIDMRLVGALTIDGSLLASGGSSAFIYGNPSGSAVINGTVRAFTPGDANLQILADDNLTVSNTALIEASGGTSASVQVRAGRDGGVGESAVVNGDLRAVGSGAAVISVGGENAASVNVGTSATLYAGGAGSSASGTSATSAFVWLAGVHGGNVIMNGSATTRGATTSSIELFTPVGGIGGVGSSAPGNIDIGGSLNALGVGTPIINLRQGDTAGAITVSSAASLLASSGSILVSADGDMNLLGSLAAGNVSLTAAGAVGIDGSVTASLPGGGAISIDGNGFTVNSGALLSAGALVNINAGTGAVLINGDLSASRPNGSTRVEVDGSGTFTIGNAGSIQAQSTVSGSAAVLIGSSVSFASITHNGSIMATGAAGANVVINANNSLTVNSGGFVQVHGDSGNASVDLTIGNSSASGVLAIDGNIRAVAQSSANILVGNDGTGGVQFNGSLFAGNVSSTSSDIRANFGLVGVRTEGGTLDLNGQVTALGSTMGRINVVQRGSGDLLVKGDLRVEGDGQAEIRMGGGGSSGALVVSPSATILAKADTGYAQIAITSLNTIQIDNAVPIQALGGTRADITIGGNNGIVVSGDLTVSASSSASDYAGQVIMRARNGAGSASIDVTGRVTSPYLFVLADRAISFSNLDVNRAQLSADSGSVDITAPFGDLIIDGIWAGGSSGTANATINVSGQVQTDSSFGNIFANNLDVTAIGDINLLTSVNDLSVTRTGGGGTITIDNAKALNVSGITGNADVNLITQAGDLTYSGDIDVPGNVVTLIPAGGLFHSGTATVRAFRLNASATGGIDMFTNVSQLNVVNSGANGVFIDNIGNVNVVALNGGSGDVTLVNTGSVTNSGIIRAANGIVTVVASSPMTINAAVTAGSDIVLETLGSAADDTLTVSAIVQSASGDVYLIAGGENVNLAGATIGGQHVGMSAAAGSVQATANSTIDADSLTVQAGNAINLNLASMTLHNAIPTLASQQFGDAQTLTDYAALGGTIPGSSIANAAFVAPNSISLGSVDFFGDYMYLKSDALTLNQAINTYTPGSEAAPVINPNVVIQMLPFDAARSVGVEQVFPTSPSPGVTYYTDADHFSRFPGTTIFAGGSLLNGSVAIGSNGIVNIGGQNFLVATNGTVTGIGNIVSTGLVGIAGVIPPPPGTTVPITTGGVTTVVQQTTDPTDPGVTPITEETVQTNLPPEEQTGTDTTPLEDPIDFIALLEQQPLVQGQVEVNTTVLACQ